ncbi:triose-phosphate isomerase [Brumimicrobium oceani]|uniref:Triosephosphate isomerase n=1 Tax=Brumimicrobium oceani TaxID=2100725 RepID=A0A2U2X0Y1_9FLAO|nr:triose-phosphate isomerase [Brumimicrobium oceani]PWH81447.1 triose-phosphate isomerase [Brumimicrobium oceani]
MRKKIVAGNWKMNLSLEEAQSLHSEINDALETSEFNCEVYHFVPSIYLSTLLESDQKVNVGSQNGYPAKNGAFTGEVSMSQLSGIGTKAVLIGHSERRQLFNESDILLKEKVDAALEEDLKVFFCCGETLEERESGQYKQTVIKQLKNSLFHLPSKEFAKIVIAYEPIWAIGTGKTASPEQANEMHKSIREAIEHAYTQEIAQNTSILYGGSCKPSNATELLNQSDIDGGLIGGASLKSEDFLKIIATYN